MPSLKRIKPDKTSKIQIKKEKTFEISYGWCDSQNWDVSILAFAEGEEHIGCCFDGRYYNAISKPILKKEKPRKHIICFVGSSF